MEIVWIADLFETRNEILPVIKEWASRRTLCQYSLDLQAACYLAVRGPYLAAVQVLLGYLKFFFREHGKEGE